jgi:predicted transposase YbfD/YdcC
MFASIVPHFDSLTDPRRDNANKLHRLADIVFLVFCAILSGVTDWVGMALWGEIHLDWLRKYVRLANGVPAHDTLMDVFGRINCEQFNAFFIQWVQKELPSLADIHIAIDGKTIRGSRDNDGSAVHMVTAFACQARVVLTQQACAEKSNEITAIPEILSMLELRGAIVSMDAMGCQKNIVKQIVDAKADFVIAVKDNQPTLHEQIRTSLDKAEQSGLLDFHETAEKGHGRVDIRSAALSTNLDDIFVKSNWPGLKAIGVVESIRAVGEKVSTENRYFITSITDPKRFGEIVRDHWSIENSQHHVLDVQFSEDAHRSREKNTVKNLALIRRISLNLLRVNASGKSIRERKLRAAGDDEYRARVIFGGTAA